jgi:hypothetical protein
VDRYCHAGTVEVRVSGTVTASSYTGCHGHDGGDTFVFSSTVQLYP